MKRAAFVSLFVASLLVALALAAGAAAHATLIRTVPPSGAVVVHAPSAVRVEFDDGIRVAPGNAAVANSGGASVLRGAPRTKGHVLTIPLRAGLAKGAYSVRWSIVSDDGHREEGLVAFAIGRGGPAPRSVLGASAGLGWVGFALRALYYLGLLAGAGAAVFGFAMRGIASSRLQRPLAHLLFFSLLATFLGASAIVHATPPGTRYALVLKVVLTISLVGGAAAALAPTYPVLLAVAGMSAIVLLAGPTLSGQHSTAISRAASQQSSTSPTRRRQRCGSEACSPSRSSCRAPPTSTSAGRSRAASRRSRSPPSSSSA